MVSNRPYLLFQVLGLILLLAIVWSSGMFDHTLYPVGLNARPCAQNRFGQVLCGDELPDPEHPLLNAGFGP